jgi:hypothetical protein
MFGTWEEREMIEMRRKRRVLMSENIVSHLV